MAGWIGWTGCRGYAARPRRTADAERAAGVAHATTRRGIAQPEPVAGPRRGSPDTATKPVAVAVRNGRSIPAADAKRGADAHRLAGTDTRADRHTGTDKRSDSYTGTDTRADSHAGADPCADRHAGTDRGPDVIPHRGTDSVADSAAHTGPDS